MKQLRFLLPLAACLLMVLLSAGCETTGYSPTSGAAAPSPSPASMGGDSSAVKLSSEILQLGEKVTMEFTDTTAAIPPITQVIREDGTLTLPFNLTVKAAGKTRGQLATDVQEMLVPKYYRGITVIIKTEDRLFFVGGEVRRPDRIVYVGAITVLKAIQSAGDFTDFADRKNVELTRLNGQKFVVNCKKAQKDPKLDLPVYPGDTIRVPRSIW